MTREIERKFLVAAVPDSVELGPGDDVRQGYLAVDGDVEVRIRRTALGAVVTIKGGAGLSRTEVELPVGEEDADALWEHTKGRRIEKLRHRVLLVGGTLAEVDVFAGALAGLCVAEVEFSDEDVALAFIPPDWFARELTGVPGWSNSALAVHGTPPDGAPEEGR